MSGIDRRLLERFLKLAGARLRGDWVVIGGTVLPLLGIEQRVTWDIDVAGPGDAGADQTLALMEIAERLGLPVEAVNQAGAYFLKRIEGWEAHLLPLHHGARATIFRPDATLFVLLKIGRLSEADLDDCRALLAYARRHDEPVDRRRLARAIGAQLRCADLTAARRERLELLREELTG